MKKAFLFVFLIVSLSAGLWSYEYIMNKNSSYGPGQPTTPINSLTGGTWDNGYYDLVLPGTMYFYFYGKRVTHVRIWTNGYITLGFGSVPTDTGDNSNDSIPTSDNPNAYIAPWWDDWDLTSSGQMYYSLGSNYLNVGWVGVPHKNDATASYDFRVGIYSTDLGEVPNSILFSYQDVDSGTGTYDRGASGTIGIEHYGGWQCQKVSYNTQVIQNSQFISFTPFEPIYGTTEFGYGDGGLTDLILFREDIGVWYIRSHDGTGSNDLSWGTLGDIALPADNDGDGDADEMVVRPGQYYLWFGNTPNFTEVWGIGGDIPMAADFNGDAISDLVVFRPETGIWYIKFRTLASDTSFQWGAPGDVPIPADYDNDGMADAAVYRPTTNMVYIRRSSNPGSPWIHSFGQDGDVVFPYNGISAYSDVGLYRPSTGEWMSIDPFDGTVYPYGTWGLESDVPVPNDWNAGGATDETIWRPSDGLWYVQGWTTFQYGYRGDKPRCRRSFLIVAPPGQGSQSPGEIGR